MKINYKNTALGLIDHPDTFNFHFPDPNITPQYSPAQLREFGLSLTKSNIKELCGHKIEYVSTSFFNAFLKGLSKLNPLFMKEEIEDSGIMITGGHEHGYTHLHTIYYTVCSVRHSDDSITYNVLYIDFSSPNGRPGTTLDVYVSFFCEKDSSEVVVKSLIWNGYINDKKDADYWSTFIIGFCMFKKYCDIETKEINPSNRRTKVAGQKYVNETDKRIKILDCTWFTNLIVSGAFMVGDETGGFLRWQHYGPGNTQKKLIWIDPFEKKGYTRVAKVLNQNQNK